MTDDNDALTGFAANDEAVAHVVIYASSGVTTEYTDALDSPEGIAWLARRLDQAKAALGVEKYRVSDEDDEVVSEQT